VALLELHPELADARLGEIGSIVSAACLAHDMGNPPFGHSGEKAISSYFAEGNGRWLRDYHVVGGNDHITETQWNDLIHFEGNANAFRLLTHQFNGRRKGGFVLTYTTLASIVKYPYSSTKSGSHGKFGFFQSEEEDYCKIANELGIVCHDATPGRLAYARHPLVYLVEAADDICYEIMDIEDAHKLRILTTDETMDLFLSFFEEKARQKHLNVLEKLGVTDTNEQIVYLRSCVIGCLKQACVNAFIDNEEEIMAGTFSSTLIKSMEGAPKEAYQRCVDTAYAKIYHSKEGGGHRVGGIQSHQQSY
jgi:dGTPase